jgi:hypothetical protein
MTSVKKLALANIVLQVILLVLHVTVRTHPTWRILFETGMVGAIMAVNIKSFNYNPGPVGPS